MQTLLMYMICRTLDKTIPKLEMKLTEAREAYEFVTDGFPISEILKNDETNMKWKYFMVIGINIAFSSRKWSDYACATWMPQGVLTWLHISLIHAHSLSLSKFKNPSCAIPFPWYIHKWLLGSHGLNITRWQEKEIGGEWHSDTLCYRSQVIFICLYCYSQLLSHFFLSILLPNTIIFSLMLLSLVSSVLIIRYEVCDLSKVVLCTNAL